MTVGARFLIPLSSVPPPLLPPFSFLCPALSAVHPSCLFPFTIPLSLSQLLNQLGLGEHCKLPQWVWVEPSRQTFLVHFQTAICATFVTGIMINSYFYCTFYCFKKGQNSCRATQGHRPHNFLAMGGIAPIVSMKSAPMDRR